MKRGDLLEAIGYRAIKKGDPMKWPEFLKKGRHRIANIKATSFGTLIKTDRHPAWINIKWFNFVPETKQ